MFFFNICFAIKAVGKKMMYAVVRADFGIIGYKTLVLARHYVVCKTMTEICTSCLFVGHRIPILRRNS